MCRKRVKKLGWPVVHTLFLSLASLLSVAQEPDVAERAWVLMHEKDFEATRLLVYSPNTTDSVTAPLRLSRGVLNYLEGDVRTAAPQIDSAANQLLAGTDTLWQIRALQWQGNVRRWQGQYERAANLYLQALARAEAANMPEKALPLYNMLGLIAEGTGDYDEGQRWLEKALRAYQSANDSMGLSQTFNNVGYLHQLAGDYFNASRFYRRSLTLKRALGDQRGLCIALVNIGELYQLTDSLDQAVAYAREGLAVADVLQIDRYRCIAAVNLGTYLEQQDKVAEALVYARLAEFLAGELGYTLGTLEAQKLLYRLLKDSDPAEAFRWLESAQRWEDTLQAQQQLRETEQALLHFHYRQKQLTDSLQKEQEVALKDLHIARQRAELQRDQVSIWGLAIGLVLVLSFTWIIAKAYRERRKAYREVAAEQKRSEALLLNILPAETARELKDFGATVPQEYESASVLFTDFKGFTFLSERLSARELVEEIDHCFRAFDAIMDEYGLEKIKTIGDAYMAAAGIPQRRGDHAVAAVSAALAIRRFMDQYASERKEEGRPFFEIRIGVHSGPLVAGVVGTRKFAYDVWGDTVNTAARMESSGEVGRVNVSEATWRLVSSHFIGESRGRVQAKNKGELEMYFVHDSVAESVEGA